MESQNQLILNQKRYFGDTIGDGIKFFRMNIGPLTQAFFTFVFPLFVIPILLAFAFGGFDSIQKALTTSIVNAGNSDEGLMSLFIAYGILYFVMILSYLVLALIVMSAALAYEENGNQVVTFDQIKSNMSRYFMNVSGSYLAVIAIMFVIMLGLGVFAALFTSIGGPLGAVFALLMMLVIAVVMVWFSVRITMMPYARMREGLSIGDAFNRSMRLVKGRWWSTFGVILVSSLIVSLAGMIFVIPFQVVLFSASFSGLDSGDAGINPFLLGLTFIFSQLGSLYLYKYFMVCNIIKYYDLVENVDGTSLANEISELGNSESSFFENEGEY